MVQVHHYTPFHKTVQSQKMSEFLHSIKLYSFKQNNFVAAGTNYFDKPFSWNKHFKNFHS